MHFEAKIIILGSGRFTTINDFKISDFNLNNLFLNICVNKKKLIKY